MNPSSAEIKCFNNINNEITFVKVNKNFINSFDLDKINYDSTFLFYSTYSRKNTNGIDFIRKKHILFLQEFIDFYIENGNMKEDEYCKDFTNKKIEDFLRDINHIFLFELVMGNIIEYLRPRTKDLLIIFNKRIARYFELDIEKNKDNEEKISQIISNIFGIKIILDIRTKEERRKKIENKNYLIDELIRQKFISDPGENRDKLFEELENIPPYLFEYDVTEKPYEYYNFDDHSLFDKVIKYINLNQDKFKDQKDKLKILNQIINEKYNQLIKLKF